MSIQVLGDKYLPSILLHWTWALKPACVQWWLRLIHLWCSATWPFSHSVMRILIMSFLCNLLWSCSHWRCLLRCTCCCQRVLTTVRLLFNFQLTAYPTANFMSILKIKWNVATSTNSYGLQTKPKVRNITSHVWTPLKTTPIQAYYGLLTKKGEYISLKHLELYSQSFLSHKLDPSDRSLKRILRISPESQS